LVKLFNKKPSDNNYVVEDLLTIGKDKPLGYLPLDTIKGRKFGGYRGIIKDIISWSESKGYNHKVCGPSNVASGAIYIYDRESLTIYLDRYKKILVDANIPVTPDEYVNYIECTIVFKEDYPEAYKVIGLTFADERFV